jgi:predicted porin
MKPGYILLLVTVLGTVSAAGAAEQTEEIPVSDRLSLQGFGTLGIARSDRADAQYVRDLSQQDGLTTSWSGKIDSMIGLQASYQINDELDGVVQVNSRYRYDGSYRPELSWAFLRYDPGSTLSLRVGRLGTEFYMLADSRMVGYSNLTVRPPPDYFGTLIFSNFDGLDISKTVPAGNGLLRGKLFAGRSPEKTAFFNDISWNLSGSLLLGGYLDYFNGPWQVRLSHAQVRFKDEMPTNALAGFDAIAIDPDLSVVDKWSRYDSLGVVYDKGPLQLQLMLSQTKHDTSAFEDTKAGYAIAAYRIGDVTPYLGYSKVKSTPVEFAPSIPSYIASLAGGSHSDQHTVFLGGRWDIRRNLDLKAQVDWIHGSPSSIFLYRPGAPSWDGHMTVFSLTLDFIF